MYYHDKSRLTQRKEQMDLGKSPLHQLLFRYRYAMVQHRMVEGRLTGMRRTWMLLANDELGSDRSL